MKDLITERDKREKMNQSIVKWWNVHYMTPEELEEAQAKEQQADDSQGSGAQMESAGEKSGEQVHDAQGILDRLNQEAVQGELQKRKEIERVRAQFEKNFNASTGSNSGVYGSGGADAEHKGQIDAILAEKDDALRSLIESNSYNEE